MNSVHDDEVARILIHELGLEGAIKYAKFLSLGPKSELSAQYKRVYENIMQRETMPISPKAYRDYLDNRRPG